MFVRGLGQSDDYWNERCAALYDEAIDMGMAEDEAREWAEDRTYEERVGTEAYFGVSKFD